MNCYIHHPDFFSWALIDRDEILRPAQEAMSSETQSIVDVPAPNSEVGPNDYFSNGDYWWPNPDTPDGLPFIRRDGEANPGNFNAHRMIMSRMRIAVSDLATAVVF